MSKRNKCKFSYHH